MLFIPRGKATVDDLGAPYKHLVMLDDAAPLSAWIGVATVLHASAPFDAVVAFNENTYEIASAISDRLAVRCTIDLELFERALDKSLTRRLLDERDIPSCRHAFAGGRADVVAAVHHVGFPCIVKPFNGEASRGVSRIVSEADIETALARLGTVEIESGVMIEEFLVGEEFSVEAISVGGEHRVIAITSKFKNNLNFVERGHVVPAPLADDARDAITRYVVCVLNALGFHDCPSHTELILTADGPRLIETHNRIGGDRIMDLVHHATGVDLYDLVAIQSIGEDIKPLLPSEIPSRQCAAVWYADPSVPATHCLSEVRHVDAVRARPHIRTLDLLRKPGSRGVMVEHSFDRSALAIATGSTAEEAVHRARDAVQSLEFLYVWVPT